MKWYTTATTFNTGTLVNFEGMNGMAGVRFDGARDLVYVDARYLKRVPGRGRVEPKERPRPRIREVPATVTSVTPRGDGFAIDTDRGPFNTTSVNAKWVREKVTHSLVGKTPKRVTLVLGPRGTVMDVYRSSEPIRSRSRRSAV